MYRLYLVSLEAGVPRDDSQSIAIHSLQSKLITITLVYISKEKEYTIQTVSNTNRVCLTSITSACTISFLLAYRF